MGFCHCHFCWKSTDEVGHLVTSRFAAICEECAGLAVEIFVERQEAPQQTPAINTGDAP
jgi:ATP-dependent protease Clp ATPase subunit